MRLWQRCLNVSCIGACCLGIKLVSLLPFSTCFTKTFHLRTSREHVPGTPQHARALFSGALRCTCNQTPPLFLSRQSTSAEPKTPVN